MLDFIEIAALRCEMKLSPSFLVVLTPSSGIRFYMRKFGPNSFSNFLANWTSLWNRTHERMTIFTTSLSGVFCPGTLTSQCINFWSNSLQMVRVYTGAHSAKMVGLEAFRDRPFDENEGQPVRHDAFTVETKSTVALTSCRTSGPKPASTLQTGNWALIRLDCARPEMRNRIGDSYNSHMSTLTQGREL